MYKSRALMSSITSACLLIAFFVLAGAAQGAATRQGDLLGPRYQNAPQLRLGTRQRPRSGLGSIQRWNEITLNANALDHDPVALGAPTEQGGPVKTARAFAIVHIAIFDAVNAIAGGYRGYTGIAAAPLGTSMAAAVAQAAHDTLVYLYPAQQNDFDEFLLEDLNRIPDRQSKTNGIALGRRAAAAILDLRVNDGSVAGEPIYGSGYDPDPALGKWRKDPISKIPVALGAYWSAKVKPFVLASADQFPTPEPPALDSAEFARAFNEVKRLGGCGDNAVACALDDDGSLTPTTRTSEQTQIGIYWGYDGAPGLGTPPRLYNQIAMKIAAQMRSDPVELARLLALINVAMADAGLAAWATKYDDEFARPITAIREASLYNNGEIDGDPEWTPLGAPASNRMDVPNFTPPFPAYTSGHATFGAALFQTLRKFYRTDRIPFSFVSDEFNGETTDNTGTPRPRVSRTFRSFSQAEEENGQSRIYLGIHWAFDKAAGIDQGRRVADYVMDNVFTSLRRR